MSEDVLTVGVIADTHVPDRAASLHPRILPIFSERGVTQILHAGDVCSREVLDELGRVAPVTAVHGNRDWALLSNLPVVQNLTLMGVPTALMHGHGSASQYFWDKMKYFVEGYRFARYQKILKESAPQARLMIFGHTHRPLNMAENGVTYFNPGSACMAFMNRELPTVGILRIQRGGNIQGEIVPLQGYTLVNRQWQTV